MTDWYLDDLAANIEPREDDNGVVQVRPHITIQIHCRIPVANVPKNLSIGAMVKSVSYQVGDRTQTVNPVCALLAGSSSSTSAFLCVGDGLAPHQHPSDFVVRRMTWEWFGKYVAAPAWWNV
jgi:hypothetical protein